MSGSPLLCFGALDGLDQSAPLLVEPALDLFADLALDGADRPVPLPVDPLTVRVVPEEGLGERHRIFSDDRADRGSVRRGLFEQVGEISEHRHQDVHRDVPLRDRPEVRQVPLQRLDRRAGGRGKRFDARLVLPPSPLVAEVADDLLDERRHHLSPSWSCSSRSPRGSSCLRMEG
jgi:hypothetical protein